MKRIWAVIFGIGLGGSAVAAEPTKRALIVAIGEYKAKGGWENPSLASANDAKLMEGALRAQEFEHIRVLADEDAKGSNIVKALEQLAKETQPGDTVVFHYSGHGSTLEDQNGDELDGVDEVLVGYDARHPHNGRLTGYVRDDVLGDKLTDIREAAGSEGHVLFLFDACHSGTITRSAPLFHGRTNPGATAQSNGQNDANPTGYEWTADPKMASFVIISAARYDQLANETQGMGYTRIGSLTYGFIHALSRLKQPTSYEAFQEMIKASISRKLNGQSQDPQFEGDLALDVLDGSFRPGSKGIPILATRSTQIQIAEGTTQGLGVGSVVEFQALSNKGDASGEVLARGTVTDSDGMTSWVTLDTATDIKKDTSWAFVQERVFERPLHVWFDPTLDSSLRQEAEENPAVRVVDDPNQATVHVRPSTADNPKLVIIDGGECDAKSTDMPDHCVRPAHQVNHWLTSRQAADFVRNFETESSLIEVEMEVRFRDKAGHFTLCAKNHRKKIHAPCQDGATPANHVRVPQDAVLPEEGTFEIWVRNTADHPVLVSLTGVDQGTDYVYRMYPPPNQPSELIPAHSERPISKHFYAANHQAYPAHGGGNVGDLSLLRLIATTPEGHSPPTFDRQAELTQSEPPSREWTATRGFTKEAKADDLAQAMSSISLTIEIVEPP